MPKQPPITDTWVTEWEIKHQRRLTLQRESSKRCYKRKKLIGQCSGCSHQVEVGFTRCQHHRVQQAAIGRTAAARAKRNFDFAWFARRRENWNKCIDNRRRRGVCEQCEKVPENPTRTRCDACLDKIRVNRNRYNRLQREAGACLSCGRKAIEGRSLCVRCQEQNRVKSRVYKARKRREKLRKESPNG